MIICPNCKEDIDDDSLFCDQCGEKLYYCSSCGKVGMGKRCSYCGGIMESPRDPSVTSFPNIRGNRNGKTLGETTSGQVASIDNSVRDGNDSLVLESMVLGICIKAMHDALIGRKEGPYTKQFSNCRYVSGCHAKLEENANHQWTITDMNSSNGTMVNGIPLQPGKPASIKNGDKVTLANITLTVKLS